MKHIIVPTLILALCCVVTLLAQPPASGGPDGMVWDPDITKWPGEHSTPIGLDENGDPVCCDGSCVDMSTKKFWGLCARLPGEKIHDSVFDEIDPSVVNTQGVFEGFPVDTDGDGIYIGDNSADLVAMGIVQDSITGCDMFELRLNVGTGSYTGPRFKVLCLQTSSTDCEWVVFDISGYNGNGGARFAPCGPGNYVGVLFGM